MHNWSAVLNLIHHFYWTEKKSARAKVSHAWKWTLHRRHTGQQCKTHPDGYLVCVTCNRICPVKERGSTGVMWWNPTFTITVLAYISQSGSVTVSLKFNQSLNCDTDREMLYLVLDKRCHCFGNQRSLHLQTRLHPINFLPSAVVCKLFKGIGEVFITTGGQLSRVFRIPSFWTMSFRHLVSALSLTRLQLSGTNSLFLFAILPLSALLNLPWKPFSF